MKLTKISNDKYLINDGPTKIEADWESTFNCLKDTFQIPVEEIRVAVNWMAATDHNTAHFGLLGRVTHTSNAALVDACIAQLEATQRALEAFHEAYKRDKYSRETQITADNAQVCWVALNIDAIKHLIEDRYEVKKI